MSLYSYEIDNISRDDWHRLISGFNDTLFEQTWSYAAARWRVGTLSHLIVKRNQDVVAVAQIVVVSLPLIDSNFAFIKSGPLWQQHGKPLNLENLQQAIAIIHQEYVVKRQCFMRIMPAALHTGSIEIEYVLLSLGFKKTQIQNPMRYMVNLSPSLEEIRKSFKPKWRSTLKKAERYELEVLTLKGEKVLLLFMPLYQKMLKRKSFADKSAILELPDILKDLPKELKPLGWFCMQNGECVGGVIISSIGDTALYLFGASDDKGLELGASFFLHWKVINWLREQGVLWYDLGGDCGNSGLRQFKSGLVGKRGIIKPLPGNFDQCNRISILILAKLAFGVKDLSSFFQKAIDNLKLTFFNMNMNYKREHTLGHTKNWGEHTYVALINHFIKL